MDKKRPSLYLTLQKLADVVSDHSSISVELMKSKGRKGEIVTARKVFSYIAKKHLLKTHESISNFLGQDHSTIVCAVKKCQGWLDTWIPSDPFIQLYSICKEELIAIGAIKSDNELDEIPLQSNNVTLTAADKVFSLINHARARKEYWVKREADIMSYRDKLLYGKDLSEDKEIGELAVALGIETKISLS